MAKETLTKTSNPTPQKPERQAPRSPLQIDLTDYLFKADDRAPIRCLGVDLSRAGLGIVGFSKLVEGEQVLLVVNGKGITLDVVWVKSDGVRPDVQHAGLKTRDVAHDLEKELQKAGVLKRVEAVAFRRLGRK
jgi:hypothetical protein